MITAASGGYLLYLAVAALLVLFWRRLRGLSFDALLARAENQHHHVHRVLAKHPARDYFVPWLGALRNAMRGIG